MRQSNYPRGRVFGTPPPEFETKPFRLDPSLQQGMVFRNIKWGRVSLIITALALLIPGLEFFLGRPELALSRLPISIAIVIGYFALVLGIIFYRNSQTAKKKANRYIYEDNRVVESTHEGIRQTLDSGIESFVPWNLIQRISLKPGWVELWFTAGMFFVIPNDAMQDSTLRQSLQEFSQREGIDKAL